MLGKNHAPDATAGAVTGAAEESTKAAENVSEDTQGKDRLEHIPLEMLKPFKNHAFKTYKGERLNQITQSIIVNGIIQPIVVRRMLNGDGYEILSGHNRVEAARKAGLPAVIAVVRELTDDEAILFVNESNIIQRSFDSWLPSEKIASIKQYHDTIKKQGERTDKEPNTSGEVRQKSEDYARARTAKAYGIPENTVKLYIRLSHLVEKLRTRLDNRDFGTTSAQHLSHTTKYIQNIIDSVLNEIEGQVEGKNKVSIDSAREIRREFAGKFKSKPSDDEAEVAKAKIRAILLKKANISESESRNHFKTIIMDTNDYERLFSEMTADEVVSEIFEAVEFFRENSTDSAGDDGSRYAS